MTRWLLALCFATSAAVAAAPSPSPDDGLGGFWALETEFASFPAGDLVVERDGGRWQATFAGHAVAVAADGDRLTATFPAAVGRFRGSRPDGDASMEGFWLRPGAVDDARFPGGGTSPFATPMTLRPDGADRWRGTVRPLPVPIRLYLKIFRDEQGRWLAAFRDPEQNRTGGASRFLVSEADGKLVFQLPNDAGGFDTAFVGTRAPGTGAIRLHWADLGRDIELLPTTPDRTQGFLPRPPGGAAYAYRVPDALDDGWPVARAADVGLDEAAFAKAVQGIIDGDPAARGPSLVHSVLVARGGKLVLEEYFFGTGRDTPHDSRSAGKTFSAVLMGAARHEGVAIGPDSRIADLLADRAPFAHPDPRKATITLAHLMTHSAGLACNDNDEASPGNEDTMQSQAAQPDLWKYTLDLPMAHDPGTRYAYCSANINLVAGALTKATGTWLPEYFQRTIAGPLGFGEWHWNLSRDDAGYLGGGSWLRPRDLLKIGQLHLDDGVWKGRRLLPEGWVAESTKARIAISPATTGYSEEEFGNYHGLAEDALAWHLGTLRVGGRVHATYSASGNGGQMLVVVPDLALAMVFTGGNYRQGGIWSKWPQQIVGDALPAGLDAAK